MPPSAKRRRRRSGRDRPAPHPPRRRRRRRQDDHAHPRRQPARSPPPPPPTRVGEATITYTAPAARADRARQRDDHGGRLHERRRRRDHDPGPPVTVSVTPSFGFVDAGHGRSSSRRPSAAPDHRRHVERRRRVTISGAGLFTGRSTPGSLRRHGDQRLRSSGHRNRLRPGRRLSLPGYWRGRSPTDTASTSPPCVSQGPAAPASVSWFAIDALGSSHAGRWLRFEPHCGDRRAVPGRGHTRSALASVTFAARAAASRVHDLSPPAATFAWSTLRRSSSTDRDVLDWRSRLQPRSVVLVTSPSRHSSRRAHPRRRSDRAGPRVAAPAPLRVTSISPCGGGTGRAGDDRGKRLRRPEPRGDGRRRAGGAGLGDGKPGELPRAAAGCGRDVRSRRAIRAVTSAGSG